MRPRAAMTEERAVSRFMDVVTGVLEEGAGRGQQIKWSGVTRTVIAGADPSGQRGRAMITPKFTLSRALLALGLVGSVAAAEPAAWRQLFNGKDLAGWDTFMAKPDPAWDVPGLKRDEKGKYFEPIGLNRDPLKVFTVETVDGAPAIHVSGQGFGVMTTRESFGNFHLRVQFKWGEKKWGYKLNAARDCGLLYFVHGAPGFDHETWPRSTEFQIQDHDTGDLYALGSQITVNARTETGPNGRPLYHYDPAGAPILFRQVAPIGNRCVRLEDAEKPN